MIAVTKAATGAHYTIPWVIGNTVNLRDGIVRIDRTLIHALEILHGKEEEVPLISVVLELSYFQSRLSGLRVGSSRDGVSAALSFLDGCSLVEF